MEATRCDGAVVYNSYERKSLMNGSKYVSNSGNKKIMGSKKADATYVSIEGSCPKTCELRGKGCYAELGPMVIHVKRLDGEVDNLTALQIARAEAKEIDNSYGGGAVPKGRDLRLHVSGDCRTSSGARIINAAIGRWKDRGGNVAWSYTHCWDHVMRETWDNVSMLASVDSTDQIAYARENGYAPSIVVSEHPSERAYHLSNSDVKWIPCPSQTRGVGCTDCRICMDADRLFRENMGVAFSVHGARKDQIKRRLSVIR